MAPSRKSILPLVTVFLVSLYFFELLIAEAVDDAHDLNNGCIDIELKALLEFKRHLKDPSGKLSSWVGTDCCKWRGVHCNNQTGNVVKLDLRNPDYFFLSSSLGGEISESLLHLKHLNYLDLSSNDFQGILIPNFLGSLERLRYLNLSYASFGGMIPPHLGNLSQLRYLDLHGDNHHEYYSHGVPLMSNVSVSNLNWLSGLSSLTNLDLGYVNLSKASTNWMQNVNMLPSLLELHLSNCGLSDFPDQYYSNNIDLFGNLTSLLVIDFSYNNFNTTPPGWLFNNISTLEVLDLSFNQLNGQLPDSFGQLKNLRSLKLSFNNFMGPLPNSIQNLTNLEVLDVHYNSISGPIPTWIGNMLRLKSLVLSFNLMNGTVPESIGQLEGLTELLLDMNSWEGVISETHLSNLAKLEVFTMNLSPYKKQSIHFLVRPEWIPPFSLLDIEISNCNIVPPKFPSWLRTQKRLEDITLGNVGISDTIPEWLWKLPKILLLDLSRNQFYGKLPSSLSFRSNALVDLRFNRLEGRIPLCLNAAIMLLGNNLFSGPIPRNIGELSMLSELDVSGNLLNGSIPSSVGKLKKLIFINLSNNHLSGKIPKNWDDLDWLDTVDLSKNKLSGGIPSWMCSSRFSLTGLILGDNNLAGKPFPNLRNCTRLFSLDLGNNKFSGEIPRWIVDRMSSLKLLRLRGNMFSGNIPEQLCGLPDLHILDLALNNLSGSIPQCLGNLSALSYTNLFFSLPNGYGVAAYSDHMELVVKGQAMEFESILPIVNLIDLSSNNIAGEIPGEITNLTTLGTLNLSRNALTGKIPEKIGAMQGLETLDLSCNQLSGPIPPNMSLITSLNHLNLSHNLLSGPIPTANQFQTFNDPSIYEANLGLCGLPLPTKCSSAPNDHDHDHKDEQEEHEDEDDQWWEMPCFLLSMGLGFAVGLWAVCGCLALNRSWRIAYFSFISESREMLSLFISVNLARLKIKMPKRTGIHG